MKYFYCPRCQTRLRKARQAWERDAGYEFLCKNCDENYFSFEALTKNDIKQRKHLNWTIGDALYIQIHKALGLSLQPKQSVI